MDQISRIVYSSIVIVPLVFCSNAYINWTEKDLNTKNNFKTKVVEISILVHGMLTFLAFFLVGLLNLTFQSLIYQFFLSVLAFIALIYIL
ncbi:MAG: hypothetical protein AAGA80_17655, partial [Cyanobacteria bacterium P01_F01_bin.143]